MDHKNKQIKLSKQKRTGDFREVLNCRSKTLRSQFKSRLHERILSRSLNALYLSAYT